MNPFHTAWLLALAAVSAVVPSAAEVSSPPPPSQPISTHVAPLPTKLEGAIAPVVEAKGTILVDLPSQTVLFSRNADVPLPIASLTKLMTVLLVVQKLPADRIVTVPKLSTTTDESRIDLKEGQQFRTEDLLAATLIASANDAAVTLARATGMSEETFVSQMNDRAATMGMAHTHFANPTGFDTGQSYSSPRDLTILARAVFAEPWLRGITGQKELKITSLDGAEFDLRNTDELLGGYLPIAGLKTGTTDAAGLCLISVLSGDRQLVAVVLNSPDRFQENKSMLDWGLRSFRY